MNALVLAQVDNLDRVVAERAYEQSFVRGVEIAVVAPSFHSGARDRLVQLKPRASRGGGREIIAGSRDYDAAQEGCHLVPAVKLSEAVSVCAFVHTRSF